MHKTGVKETTHPPKFATHTYLFTMPPQAIRRTKLFAARTPIIVLHPACMQRVRYIKEPSTDANTRTWRNRCTFTIVAQLSGISLVAAAKVHPAVSVVTQPSSFPGRSTIAFPIACRSRPCKPVLSLTCHHAVLQG